MTIKTLIKSNRTLIMGILNVTPDSFSDGGKFLDIDDALHHVEMVLNEGADIIDIGAESTRPGSLPISVDEERRRLETLVTRIISTFDCPVSLDTSKPDIAALGIDWGVSIINDVKGTTNPDMWRLVSLSDVYYVCMHMQHTPDIMQINPTYSDVVDDVYRSFEYVVAHSNINLDQLILDPGIGFGKTVDQNLMLLKSIGVFRELGAPVLIGTSRKSFLGALTGASVDSRLEETIASSIVACEYGASLLRVHDVKSIKKAVVIADAIRNVR